MIHAKLITLKNYLLAISIFAFILCLYGAVPFFATPTQLQAFWTTGFSQSFVNDSIFSIHAKNFGVPEPAAISFGLAGAWLTSIFIRLGLHPADAYSAMCAFWLAIAYVSAYKIGRFFGVKQSLALLGALLWMSMPIIWVHAGYSMLSLGISLLPFYFLATLKVYITQSELPRPPILVIGTYLSAAVVAVFMDGYTFMMFATGSSLLCIYIFLTFSNLRKYLLIFAVPVHVLSFALAYFLYSLYIGKIQFEPQALDVFRGFGLDLSFIVIPTKGILWLFDTLGLSLERSNILYFGDASVWTTTFCLPIVIIGLFGWWRVKRQAKIASGLLILAIFSFYMALGPSLKIKTIKPAYFQNNTLITTEFAKELTPTGNAWISKNLPGFNVMRASYRWSALGIFSFWMLFLLYIGKKKSKENKFIVVLLIGLIIFNIPNMAIQWQNSTNNRQMFLDVDHHLIATLKKALIKNECVAFIPFGNDFLVNYLASTLKVHTYNIGGDKNLSSAIKNWPKEMLIFNGEISETYKHFLPLLLNTNTDVIVIPYFDLSWKDNNSFQDKRKTTHTWMNDNFSQKKNEYYFIIQMLKKNIHLQVTDSDFFATVRLRHELSASSDKTGLKNITSNGNPSSK